MKAVQECLKQRVNPNAWGSSPFSPLMLVTNNYRASAGSIDKQDARRLNIIGLLMKHRADPNAFDDEGNCALHFADTPEIATTLLENSADVDAVNADGETALLEATRWGRTEVVRVLLKHRANTRIKNKEGKTALDLAPVADFCKPGFIQCQELIYRGPSWVSAEEKV